MTQSRILKVGLTGGIGSGKSTVSRIIKSCGVPIVDADIIAREVLIRHPVILGKIRESFGGEYFDEDGSLIRKKLGSLIFSDKDKKLQFEEIILPFIKDDIYRRINEYDRKGEEICIVDAPTLIESGLYSDMDYIIVVSVDANVQIERVINRDGLSRTEALQRINNQMPTDEKCSYADFVIDNNGDFGETEKQVHEIVSRLQNIRGKNVSKKEKQI